MFEVFLDQPRVRRVRLAREDSAAVIETQRKITATSGLVWGEHCTECAWPTCYSHCALYTPREDLNCRRFDEGIVPVDVELDAGEKRHAMRIGFRQWGKLEAHQHIRLLSVERHERLTHLDEAARTALRVPVPFAARRRLSHTWSKVQHRLTDTRPGLDSGDVFLVEAINEGHESLTFTLTILDDGGERRFFQHGFDLRPGYNRVLVDVASIARHVDLERQVFVRLEPTVIVPGNSVLFLHADFVSTSAPFESGGGPAVAEQHPKVKCVVWDLDNTVWDGTLVEDGLDAIRVRPEVVEVVKALDARGVLQSVASKNSEAEAQQALERAGLSEYVLHPQISWGPKSLAVREIASILNIGMDTLLFVDDQPFERAEVSSANPTIRTVDAAEVHTLLDRGDLDVPVTAESRRRRSMYREESSRRAALDEAPVAFDDFLRSCNIALDLLPPSVDNAERIFELGQRTNQLNYSGARLSRDEVDAIVRGTSAWRGVVLSAADRFGDYGIVGFVTLDLSDFTVTNFFMSCRVQRKKVENAFFTQLLQVGRRAGFSELRIRHRATSRNAPAVEVLQGLGAVPAAWLAQGVDAEDEVLYVLSCEERLPGWDIVSVHDEVLDTWVPTT